MKTLTIMQVGDLHYDQADAGPAVDAKDPHLSPVLVSAAAPSQLRAVMQAAQKRCANDAIDGIVFCGDLTSRGALSVYRECVEYLDVGFSLAGGSPWSEGTLHAVPGNHDVDRALVDPDGVDLFSKFVPLKQAWEDRELNILACDSVRESKVGESGREAALLSVNSCIGCGEKRSRVGEFTETRKTQLEKEATEGIEAAADALWEGIDTPLMYEDHLRVLGEAIDDLSPSILPIVTAHHNLLPQAMPRIDVYTELMNGGAIRARLSSFERWILYLHGHIHDDPIEIIDQRYPGRGRILSVSAPEFRIGFNLISVAFGFAGRPVGCTITRFRYEHGGEVRPQDPVRIGLRWTRDEPDQLVGAILDAIPQGQSVRFRELEQRLSGTIPSTTRTEQLESALLEAEWSEHLSIDGREDAARHWTIRRELL